MLNYLTEQGHILANDDQVIFTCVTERERPETMENVGIMKRSFPFKTSMAVLIVKNGALYFLF